MLTPYSEFWDAQRKFLHCDEDVTLDVCVYQGGVGSGKTMIGSLLGTILCNKYPGILGLVLAKTYPMVRDTTMRTYFEHFRAFGYKKKRDYDFNKSESLLTFLKWGGSQVMFRHLQDPEKIKSINAGYVEVEECSQITEADFDMTLTRLRQSGVKRKRWFGHTNPHSAKGWIYERFVSAEARQNKKVVIDPVTKDEISKESLPGMDGKTWIYDPDGNLLEVMHFRRVIAPTTDNKALSVSYIQSLRQNLDPEMYKIFVLGQDGDYTAGLVNHSFSDLNITNTEYKPDLAIYLTCDFNVDPMSWALAHRYNGEYHFFDEIVVEHTQIDPCVDEFVRRYPDHQAGVIITGDASGNNRSVTAKNEANVTVNDKKGTAYTEMLNRFTHHKYPSRVRVDVRESNPLIASRIAAFNAMVCNTNGVRRVFVNLRCKWLIWNMNNLKYKEGTGIIDEPTADQIEKSPKLKFTKHIYDAASYLVEKYDPIKLVSPTTQTKVIVPKAMKFNA
jgi:PBSX family phage terminase large subunit